MQQAVVLGGSRGLGAHISTRLAQSGWKVTATGRSVSADNLLTGAIDYFQADLNDDDALSSLDELLSERRPELIVHNAVSYGSRDGSQPDARELVELFRVNAITPYILLREYLSAASRQGSPCSCITISSDSIYNAKQSTGPYAASKAAMKVLATALADSCRGSNASVSTLLLGPLADERKIQEFQRIAEARGMEAQAVARTYLHRSNTSLVIDSLIDFESCYRSIEYLANLGPIANGMVCKLDGGSSGSLI
ncbi:SDR family oxidoreductase [Nocardia amamiensis]|uniref:SDR family oxidoreductase n=1 Tax=Nocardia amamiensis TaxID=404578 RepID=A0ABS0CR26_9NOCA|nr:SDR family oxidoreductase [Nocardia amamiensis]MBF6299071.1 SDR family oxidoreductase [Nocardia amamiensis]